MAAGIHTLGVASLRAGYQAGRISVAAAVDHYLARIERFDPTLKAFTFVDPEGARTTARISAERFESGTARPLEGVPIAIKANIDVAGWPVTGGIAAWRDRRPTTDAQAVRLLKDAGAIPLGLTNMHEGALGATTDNPFYGQTQNPHRSGFTPGGSSGGSAAAVAAGLCAAALGSDTLGSIRIPAGWCGISGLKPAPGRVPNGGLIHLVERWDVIGPLARSVEDCAALFAVLSAPREARPAQRIAAWSGRPQIETDHAVDAAVRLSARLLEGLGLRVDEPRLRIDFERVRLAGFMEASAEARTRFGAAATAAPQGFSPAFRTYLDFAAGIEPATRAQGQKAIEAAATELRAQLQLADAILIPVTPGPAFAHGTHGPVTLADFTALANFAGLPALALPAGWTSHGLPVGVQLIGRAGEDESLLALGAKLESALNAWQPPVDYR
ncbi:amidase [Sandaracinobacter neustonicus]|uniref:amidase n=1 Tax=Sandaracinobacter neustonicus TaxID=1715348 RepID=UPI0015E2BED0|nr:amidase [Sandaracinobacter neustonicus]